MKSTFTLMLFFIFTAAFAQQKRIVVKGVVSDEENNPLQGVSIIEKGTNNGTTTDNSGRYTINTTVENPVLVFTLLGMKSREVPVQDQAVHNITLSVEVKGLNEVVVVGYGKARKKDITGSVSSINLENSPIADVPNVNTLQTMKGKVAGLNIGNVTSAGGQPSLIIRGQNSLSASNTPLLVVDGVIYEGGFSTINPNDIASVDILKDASAAAVYGSQSANGVIIITTKRGKTGAPQIGVNAYYGIQNWTTRPEMMNGEQAIQFRKDVAAAGGAVGADLDLRQLLSIKEYEAFKNGHEVDWFDEVTRQAAMKNAQVSVSGATNKINYYLSGNILDQKGIVKGDNYNQKSVLMKVESNLTDWLLAGANISADIRDYSGSSADLYTATYLFPYGYTNVLEPDFEHWLERYPGGNMTWSNPLLPLQNYNKDMRYTYRGLGYLEVKVPWVKGLEYRLNYSARRYQGESAGFTDEKYYVNTLKVEELKNPNKYLNQANGYKNSSTESHYLVNNILSYNRHFDKHSVSATLMSERQAKVNEHANLSASDFSQVGSTILGVNALQLANNEKRSISTGYTKLTQLAYLFRVNYNYQDKYHATFSYRRDGYSGFAPGNKYGDFKALGVAWTITQEDFMKNFGVLSYLKLRLSYGENGNPSVGAYGTLPRVGNSEYIFGQTTVNTAYQSSLSNKQLKWEQTDATNLGLDFAFLNDRISGTINLYNSKTTNLLMTRRLPIMTGYGSILANIGEINNKGIELNVTTANIQSADLKWSTEFIFWKNKNKIVHLYGVDADGDGKEDDDLGNRWFIGKSLGAIYDYTFDGIVQTDDKEYQEKYGAKPGDVKFKDLNGDGKIDAQDRSIIGYSKPNYNLNIANTVTYKNFTLYLNVGYINGGNNHYMASNPKGIQGALAPGSSKWINLPYWTPERPSNKYPRPNYGNPYGYGFYQNHSFVRLQDATIGYRLKAKVLEDLSLKNLRVYISGKNLLTFSDWIGWDPESATSIGEYTLPGLRTVTFGLDITF